MTTDAEKDAALRFRVETACDGYSALWESDVPDDVLSPEDYLRGAHDAAEAIRACTTSPTSSTSEADQDPATTAERNQP